MEEEVVRLAAKEALNPHIIADRTGLSKARAEFILAKLRREQRIE